RAQPAERLPRTGRAVHELLGVAPDRLRESLPRRREAPRVRDRWIRGAEETGADHTEQIVARLRKQRGRRDEAARDLNVGRAAHRHGEVSAQRRLLELVRVLLPSRDARRPADPDQRVDFAVRHLEDAELVLVGAAEEVADVLVAAGDLSAELA